MKKGHERKWIVLLLMVFLLGLFLPARGVMADELSDLRKELAESKKKNAALQRELDNQKKKTAELEDRVSKIEAVQKSSERSFKQSIEKVDAKADKAQQTAEQRVVEPFKVPSWVQKIEWSGDFRYRYEFIDKEGKNERHRNRIRGRLGLSAELNDAWDVYFRIATGERDLYVDVDKDGPDPNYVTGVGVGSFGDPISTNQTLDGFFSSKDIWLDLGYFAYHPAWIQGLNIFGGKVKNPFYRPGKNQLIWDDDLNPEGGGVQYVHPLGKNTKVHVNGGGFWVEERSSGVDTSLWGIQSYIDHAIGNPDHIIAGASYFDYGNIRGAADTYGVLGANAAMPGGGAWASDYDIFEVFAEYGTKLAGLPFAVYGDYAKNIEATTNQDTGWLIGGKINKAKKVGTWEVSYDYRDLEADAVLAAFTDSDFVGGGIGGAGALKSKGHRFGFAYQLHKNVQAAVTYFDNEIVKSSSDTDYRRLQADLKFKF